MRQRFAVRGAPARCVAGPEPLTDDPVQHSRSRPHHFKDIQTYERAHRVDMKRKAKKEK